MIHILVTYTISPDFAEENKQNIALFLEDFKNLNTERFRYSVFTDSQGNTFTHLSQYADEHIQQELLHTPSFIRFQKERDFHILHNSHTLEQLIPVGYSTLL